VILPDVNLLVYAYNAAAPEHPAARAWWEARLSGRETVGLAWLAVLGYLRIVTSPGARHLDILEGLAEATRTIGTLATDLHLAALAIEHQAELHSNDTDLGRFPGLRWRNPLARRPGERS
jgi:hypothetical protein